VTERRALIVDPGHDGERLDRYLAGQLAGDDLSRSRIQRLIKDGAVRVNGVVARPSVRLSPGDGIAISFEGADDAGAPAPAPGIPLSVLHADDDIVVVDKAAGQVVHPAVGHTDDTLVNALVARFPDLVDAFNDVRPGIVHRLDRDTSGVMVVARSPDAAADLKRQFKARTVDKAYLLLAKGRLAPPEGVIEAPIGRDPRQRKRMAALPDGRPAQTEYRVLAVAGDYSWVEARPRTGRTHQIRVHLSAVGHPVAGDVVYGRRDRRVPRLALHAWRLAFDHPASGERAAFVAPLPPDLATALLELGIGWDAGA
jgi:23S rRNA pseudouridine1911/1915/1917 synthase